MQGKGTRITALIRELETNKAEVSLFFRGLEEKHHDKILYEDDQAWRIKDLLAHFVTIERSMHWLFDNLLMGGMGTPDTFDIDLFNNRQVAKHLDAPLETLIGNFEATRSETISIIRNMTESDLDREGRHPIHGHGKLETFLRWAAQHTTLHLHDIQRSITIEDA